MVLSITHAFIILIHPPIIFACIINSRLVPYKCTTHYDISIINHFLGPPS